MVPKPMLESNPPTLMSYFYDKKALTRVDIENAGGYFGKSKTIPQRFMLVAPHFKKKYSNTFKILGLKDVETDGFLAWFAALKEVNLSPQWENDELNLQVVNSYDLLTSSKASSRIKNLLEDAPTLENKTGAKQLTA